MLAEDVFLPVNFAKRGARHFSLQRCLSFENNALLPTTGFCGALWPFDHFVQ